MEVIPAVDIMSGRVVRLSKGKPNTAKTYKGYEDPLKVAQRWESEGAKILHVIDLDAATGHHNNKKIIEAIINKVKIPVQVGGGIRSRTFAEKMLNLGANRVIIATLAFEREDVVKTLLDEFGKERIIVALDYINDLVMTQGWKNSTGLTLIEAMEKFSKLGVDLFLLTSISMDGLLKGPDYTTLKEITGRFKKKLIVAGGITSLNDLIFLKSTNVDGVVVGKALYEEKFTFQEALKITGCSE